MENYLRKIMKKIFSWKTAGKVKFANSMTVSRCRWCLEIVAINPRGFDSIQKHTNSSVLIPPDGFEEVHLCPSPPPSRPENARVSLPPGTIVRQSALIWYWWFFDAVTQSAQYPATGLLTIKSNWNRNIMAAQAECIWITWHYYLS